MDCVLHVAPQVFVKVAPPFTSSAFFTFKSLMVSFLTASLFNFFVSFFFDMVFSPFVFQFVSVWICF